MAIAGKEDEFDAATSVMESGLLRVLTRRSADRAADAGERDVDVAVEPPKDAAPPTAAPAPPTAAPAPPSTGSALPKPRPRSRIYFVAGIVTAAVLGFDAWLVVSHRPAPLPATIPARVSLPRYMLLPPDPPPAATPPPTPTTTAAPLATAAPPPATAAHRHSRHRHAHR